MNRWYDMDRRAALEALKTNDAQGLTQATVEERLTEHGYNEYTEKKKDSIGRMILHQFKDVSVLILLLAAILSFALAIRDGHGFIEPIVIMAIIIMNSILGITQERSAERALDALGKLNSPSCIVLREGTQSEIETRNLVPGDIIVLKTGDLVPADARLMQSVDLAVDESSLTGESMPAEKDANAQLEGRVSVGDRVNMVFSGTLVTGGRAVAVVTQTGMHTEMGKIAGYLNDDQKLKTPLQVRLDKIGKLISLIAIVSAVVLFFIGTLQGEEFWTMIVLAVTLAVAAVPETLSLIVTLTLAHGVKNMVGKNALIRKLPAVETLGSTSVICSDKTGTLTQNRMAIKGLWMGGEAFHSSDEFDQKQLDFIKKLALASNATVETREGETTILGDPTESAILRLLMDKGVDKAELMNKHPRAMEIAFSSERKMMTVAVKMPEGDYMVITKGALDRIPFEANPERLVQMRAAHDEMAGRAMRVIAMGSKRVDALPVEGDYGSLESDLHIDGIIGLIDPPRAEAAQAIATAKKAGIRTVMITGDHKVTATAIAKDVGILNQGERVLTGDELSEMDDETLSQSIRDYSVYARVSPEDKIRIVEAWQDNDEVVAMTGDGVNDAPALKAADVGVAMGLAGTEVARSASDMVLTDDNFATIVDAVKEGRNVYANIKKTIYFLLVCNLSEIAIILGAQLVGWGVPVTPIMLLLINVIGDGIPGLQLAKEKSGKRIMNRPPIERGESFFADGLMYNIVRQTIVFTIVTWVGYYLAGFVQLPGSVAPSHAVGQSVAFLILGWTSILHIFTVRSRRSIFKQRCFRDNPMLIISAAGTFTLITLLIAVRPLASVFNFAAIGGMHWLIAALLSVVPTLAAEVSKALEQRDIMRLNLRRLFKRSLDEE